MGSCPSIMTDWWKELSKTQILAHHLMLITSFLCGMLTVNIGTIVVVGLDTVLVLLLLY